LVHETPWAGFDRRLAATLFVVALFWLHRKPGNGAAGLQEGAESGL